MRNAKQYKYALSAAVVASLALSGCDKLTPNGQSNTLTLLRDGSERVCAASDVQDSLRKILLPKLEDLPSAATLADKQAALASIRLTFDLTTLQSFDKSVNRATCETTVKIGGQDGGSDKFSVAFQVSPSSDDPSGLVITTRDTEAGTAVAAAVRAALEQRVSQRQGDEDAAAAQAAKAKVLAVISPKWLVGSWIPVNADASNCSPDHAIIFSGNGVFSIQGHTGRWLLEQDHVRFVGNSPTRTINDTGTISQADAVSFNLVNGDGTNTNLRRCARSEIPVSIDSTVGMDTMPDNTASPN